MNMNLYSDDSLDDNQTGSCNDACRYRQPPSPDCTTSHPSSPLAASTSSASRRRTSSSSSSSLSNVQRSPRRVPTTAKRRRVGSLPDRPSANNGYQDEPDKDNSSDVNNYNGSAIDNSSTMDNYGDDDNDEMNDDDANDTNVNANASTSTALTARSTPEIELEKRRFIEHLINDLSASVVYDMLSKHARYTRSFLFFSFVIFFVFTFSIF
jgi:hypothetical protein